MGEHVVQLAGDPEAFVLHRAALPVGLGTRLLLSPRHPAPRERAAAERCDEDHHRAEPARSVEGRAAGEQRHEGHEVGGGDRRDRPDPGVRCHRDHDADRERQQGDRRQGLQRDGGHRARARDRDPRAGRPASQQQCRCGRAPQQPEQEPVQHDAAGALHRREQDQRHGRGDHHDRRAVHAAPPRPLHPPTAARQEHARVPRREYQRADRSLCIRRAEGGSRLSHRRPVVWSRNAAPEPLARRGLRSARPRRPVRRERDAPAHPADEPVRT